MDKTKSVATFGAVIDAIRIKRKLVRNDYFLYTNKKVVKFSIHSICIIAYIVILRKQKKTFCAKLKAKIV